MAFRRPWFAASRSRGTDVRATSSFRKSETSSVSAVAELRKSAVDPDPLAQFRRWYADAEGAEIKVPQAMALATSTPDGAPSVRMLLLKSADERGFLFFNGYV